MIDFLLPGQERRMHVNSAISRPIQDSWRDQEAEGDGHDKIKIWEEV
jgi:hypothetical protein